MNKRNHRQPQLKGNRDGFFMIAVGDAALAIGKKLTGSQLRLWLYLMMVDPFSDYTASGEPIYHQIPNPADLAIKIGVSRRTVEKDLNLLRNLGLYDYKTTEWWGHNLSAHRARESSKRLKAKQGKGGYLTAETANLTHSGLNNRSGENLTGNTAKKNSDIYKDRVRDQTLQTDQTDQTFSEGERETKVEQLDHQDPEVNSKESKQPQTNNFSNPAQESVNPGEKFSAARLSARRTSAAAVFEIPAEKKRGFYDAVRQYAANHGVSRPPAYAKKVMADLEQTGMCSLWDDFEAGLKLGTSDRPSHEWLDPETGKPYPFLVRAVEEIAKAKSNDSVAAATEAAKIINNPKLCQPVWASVKRELLHYHDEAKRMQRLGVRHTYLPPRYSDKPLEPALSEVKDAIASITPGREKSQATLTPVAKKREKSETLPDPWEQNPLERIEQRERKTEEALEKARNEAQRQLKASQIEQALEQIKASLPTDQKKRQSQLQGWMNGKHPYPAIAKRLIETNYQWGLYLEGKRVLEEEF
ncbi:hypothetical protein [Coleofasciculus sp.]|uniref:hypothetical protein n=1 Tax=Coleofasciculus sp. TaxID=3100458 RepID=UPI003A1AA957